MTNDADELVARHQKVREFVEEHYPDIHVTDITERARTQYWRKLGSESVYHLATVESVFTVEATSESRSWPSIRCEIALMRDGTFKLLQDRQFYVYP